MFGIGLGAAMSAFNDSQKQRQEDEDRKRRLVLQQREDEEYNRAKKLRDSVDAIGIQTKKDFDAQVAAGTKKADQFDSFWREQALPKLKETYLTQGNFEAADRLQTWGENADVKAGAKLSMSAMFKAANGDTAGALDDAIKAGQTKGYLDHGYELVDKTEIVDPKTKQTVGYRLNVKTPDGKTVQQDIASADIPRLVSTLTNPEAAWKSYEAAQTQKAADARELKNYEEKKKIDKVYSTDNKNRIEAIKSLRKRMPANDPVFDGTPFDNLPSDQQESLINKEMSLQAGGGSVPTLSSGPGISTGSGAVSSQPSAGARPTAAPGLSTGAAATAPKVVIDKVTGQRVNPAAVPGVTPGPQQAPADADSAPRPAPPGYAPAASQVTVQPGNAQQRAQYLVQSAQDAISNGERPSRVADQLRQAGVPEDQWPTIVTSAVQKEAQTRGLGMVP